MGRSKETSESSRLVGSPTKIWSGRRRAGTILLAKELHAGEALLDDLKARKLARAEGLRVRGSVGLLEAAYKLGYLSDLRAVFRQLLAYSYIDRRLLDLRLRALGFPPL